MRYQTNFTRILHAVFPNYVNRYTFKSHNKNIDGIVNTCLRSATATQLLTARFCYNTTFMSSSLDNDLITGTRG